MVEWLTRTPGPVLSCSGLHCSVLVWSALTSPALHSGWGSAAGKVSTLAEAAKPEAGYEGHTYAVVTPVLADWAFVGEPNKFVTAASLRFTDVSARRQSIRPVDSTRLDSAPPSLSASPVPSTRARKAGGDDLLLWRAALKTCCSALNSGSRTEHPLEHLAESAGAHVHRVAPY